MGQETESGDVTNRISGADALFVLSQFAGLCPKAHVTILVRSKEDKNLFSHHLPVESLLDEWNEWVLAAISSYNARGSHVLYGINPTMNPRRGAVSCLSTLAAYFSLKGVSLGDRLRQMAVLHKTKFEPSYVVQWPEGLCGVYVLDQQLSPDRHRTLSRHLAHQIDSAGCKLSDHPFLMLPLPGFFYKGKIVRLLHPVKPIHVAVRLYSEKEFSEFPAVTMESVERFYREADGLGDERAMEFVSNLIREAQAKGDQRAVLLGLTVKKRQTELQRFRNLALGFVEPTKTLIPDLHALPLKYWSDFLNYVRFGAGMNADVLARLVRRMLHGALDVSIDRASAFQSLDRYIIREMIYAGYTATAAVEFFSRPEHNMGIGKDATYISSLYQVEIAALRTAAKEAQQGEIVAGQHTLEFITMTCNAIDRIGDAKKLPRGAVHVDGDVLGLNPKKSCEKLYTPEMVRLGKTPLSLKQLRFIFLDCKDHYWLGKLNSSERYQWRFSISRLRQHGLLKIFTTLTK